MKKKETEPAPSANQAPPKRENTAARVSPGPGEAAPFEAWPEVVERLKAKNGMLYGFLQHSSAYLTATHVLIDAQELFMQYVRDHAESKELIKQAIQETAGISLPIGPYDPNKFSAPQAQTETAALDALDALINRARENGVEVEIRE